jgi:hypothetical protein
VICSRPEFEGLQKSGCSLPLAEVDVWHFEHSIHCTVLYLSVMFGAKGLIVCEWIYFNIQDYFLNF